jgi:EAL and modified HD-GYP domain-containing signal transduction protein
VNLATFITRQPVLNRQRAITANRLLVHVRGAEPGKAASAVLNGLAEVWPSQRTVFVGLGGVSPDPGLLEWRPPDNAMLEIPAGALDSATASQLMHGLAELGVPLCLDGHVPASSLPAGVSFSFSLADASGAVRPDSLPGVPLARNPADVPAFDAALQAGFAGASGWFFLKSRPASRRLIPGQAQIVRLLNLVRKNAEIREIEQALKQDVALSYKLLRYINSAGFGLSCEVQSFRHAVAILGYAKLHRWLSLLLVTATKDPAAPALMQAAIVRGRFMELAGKGFFDRQEQDNLFITGTFSLLDALLGTPMEAILEDMVLPQPVTDALLGRESVLKPFLELARACEDASGERLASLAPALHLSAEATNRALLCALSFADGLQLD